MLEWEWHKLITQIRLSWITSYDLLKYSTVDPWWMIVVGKFIVHCGCLLFQFSFPEYQDFFLCDILIKRRTIPSWVRRRESWTSLGLSPQRWSGWSQLTKTGEKWTWRLWSKTSMRSALPVLTQIDFMGW